MPDPGQGHIEGVIVDEALAFEEAARKFLSAKVPTIFPGPLVLWHWNETAKEKAVAVKALYETLKACCPKGSTPMLIPMADYRPKYPKINRLAEAVKRLAAQGVGKAVSGNGSSAP